MNDPPAPDLGTLDAATRMRLENVRYPQRAMAMDVRTILAAYDAQAARLAAVEPVYAAAVAYVNADPKSYALAVRLAGAVAAAGAVGAGEARDGD